MARYVYRDLGPDFTVVVSTHGWFEIRMKDVDIASLAALQITGSYIYRAPISELGIIYDPSIDDLGWGLEEPEDEYEYIKGILLAYLKERL